MREPTISPSSDSPEPGDPARAVLRIALPIILANLSVPLVGLVDVAVIGRTGDAAALAAIAMGSTVFSLVYWGFGFLRMGTTGIVAQRVGGVDDADPIGVRDDANAGRGTRLREILAQGGCLALAIGIAIVLLQSPISWASHRLIPVGPEAQTGFETYFRIRIWSAPAVLGSYVLIGTFIGLQRSASVLWMQLLLNLGNVGLALLFVPVLGWGLAGAGAASLIAEWAAFVFGLLLLVSPLARRPGMWRLRDVLRLARMKALLAMNTNLFVRTICLLGAITWFNRCGAMLGDVVLAANAVLLQFISVMSYGLDGFAHAAESLVGAALGDPDRERSARRLTRAIHSSTWLAVVTAIAFSLCYGLFGHALVATMTTVDEIRSTANAMLPWLVGLCLVAVWSYQLDGIAIGALRTREMRDSMLFAVTAFVAFSWAGFRLYGNAGLWASYLGFFAIRGASLQWALRGLFMRWETAA